MPKHTVHAFVLNTVVDRLCESDSRGDREIGEVMRRNHFAAVLGSFGPDLHAWAPDSNESSVLLRFLFNMKLAVDQYDHVAHILNEPPGKYGQADEGTAASASRKELASKIRDEVNSMVSSISPGILNGIADGYDLFADPAGLQSLIGTILSHTIENRDSCFTLARYKWSDRLHFWKAGEYARNLLRAADDEAGRAYAYGYMTHIASDLIVHQMVRKAIGGSYNKNPQGHFVCESFLDAWCFHEQCGQPLNGNMMRDLGLEDSMPVSVAHVIREAMALTYGGEGVLQYPSGEELSETYERIRYYYVLQDGLHLQKPVAPFPGAEAALGDVLIKYGKGRDKALARPVLSRLSDGGESHDHRAELEYGLSHIADDVKCACEEIEVMLDTLCRTGDCRDVASLLYGIWSKAYEIMSGLLYTIALTGFIIPEPEDLGHAYVQKLLHVNAVTSGEQGPEYYISGRKFDVRKIVNYVDACQGDGPIIAGDDDDLGNAVDMAAWMISGSGDPAIEKYIFANWAMESEEL